MHAALLTVLLAGLAAPVIAAPKDQLAPCRQLAGQVRERAADRPDFLKLDVNHLLAPTLIVSATDASPPPAVRAAAARLLEVEPDSRFELSILTPGVWRAELIEGTADCTRDVFFRLEAGNGVKLPDPPAFKDLCWESARSVGAMNHAPLVVEQDGLDAPLPGFDVEVVPWRAGWGAACQLSVRYRDEFRVAESFSADAALRLAAAPIAVQLAAALARTRSNGEPSLLAVAPAATARRYPALVAASKAYAVRNAEGEDSLPTFGAKAKTEFADFSDTIATAVLLVDGHPTVARVGVGGVGWRPIGDYLVVFYRQGTTGLKPVASFVVSQEKTGLLSATAKVPTPASSH
jgi:hypothetical protein